MNKPLAAPQDQTAAQPQEGSTQIQEGLPQPRRAAAVACVLGALVLVVLDAAIANVALPTISQSLQVSSAERSEEHTSELQSLMRISYAVFCLKKKKKYDQQLCI